MPNGDFGAACAVIFLGAAGLLWAVWMRWGPARMRSWWVRTDPNVARSGTRSMDTEDFALIAEPALSLMVLGGGLLLVPGAPAALLVALCAITWAVAAVLVMALLVSSAFLPMWAYPSWLRGTRRGERRERRMARR